MQRVYILSYSLLFIIFSCNTLQPIQSNKSNEQIVTLKSYFPVSSCGVNAFAGAYCFSLLNKDSIFIGVIRCPNDYAEKEFFTIGTKYLVHLTSDNIEDSLNIYTVLNPYKEKGYSTCLVSKIQKY